MEAIAIRVEAIATSNNKAFSFNSTAFQVFSVLQKMRNSVVSAEKGQYIFEIGWTFSANATLQECLRRSGMPNNATNRSISCLVPSSTYQKMHGWIPICVRRCGKTRSHGFHAILYHFAKSSKAHHHIASWTSPPHKSLRQTHRQQITTHC